MRSAVRRKSRSFLPCIERLEARLAAANALDTLLSVAGIAAFARPYPHFQTPGEVDAFAAFQEAPTASVVEFGVDVHDSPPAPDITTSTPLPSVAPVAVERSTVGQFALGASPVADVFGPEAGLFGDELFVATAAPRQRPEIVPQISDEARAGSPDSDSLADPPGLPPRAASETVADPTPAPGTDVVREHDLLAIILGSEEPGGGVRSSLTIDSLGVPAEADEGETVTFVALASGGAGPLTYTWQFGDGHQASGVDLQMPTHAYDTNNPPATPYTVTLTVTDGFNVVSDNRPLLVNNLPPSVSAGDNRRVHEGATVVFTGTATDPGNASDIASIEWDFDYQGTFTVDASGTLTPSNVYSTLGAYVVALRATDNAGAASLAFVSVDVRTTGALIVNAGTDRDAAVGTPVTFSGSYVGGGTIPPANLAWDFNYNGTSFNPMVTGTLTPTHTFTSPGLYQVALRVIGNQCGAEIDALTVGAWYVGPTANAGADRTIDVGDTIVFSGSYTDPDGTVASEGIAWDFDYDLETFTEDVTGTLTPSRQFSTAGTFTVALRIRDNHEMESIDLLSVTVLPVPPYVYAGANVDLAAGETAKFLGFYRMASTVAPAGIEWDFNYNGTTFNPDPTAIGNLTPSRLFNIPGTYTAALRVTDSGSVSRIGTASVLVVNARPVVTIADTLTTTQGQLASFSATVSSPDPVRIEWDFHTEDGSFNPDPLAEGQLNPTHTYIAAGTALAAIRVTNLVGGAVRLRTIKVTVNDVPPTATVTHSGPTSEGSPVTFTVSNVTDVNPNAAFDYAADWTGSGEFEIIPEDRRILGSGSVSFTRIWDDNGSYPVTIRVLDMEGDFRDYPLTATVTNVVPNTVLQIGASTIGPDVPIRFHVWDPSWADTVAGFTHFYSINGGAFVEAPSGQFVLPPLPPGTYTLRAYARDKDGATGNEYVTTVDVAGAAMAFRNTGTGSVRLNWTGASEPLILGPNQTHYFTGVVTGLTATLLTSGAEYGLSTNGSIETIDYATGVVGVLLSVDTVAGGLLPPIAGDGHIGTIQVPAGGTMITRLSMSARGYLGSIVGPSVQENTRAEGSYITFDDLRGSITGLDFVFSLWGRWLGDNAGSQVAVNCGINELVVHGIRGRLLSDRFRSTFDSSVSTEHASIGNGGASGYVELGKTRYVGAGGTVDNLRVRMLSGDGGSIGNFRTTNRLYLDNVDGDRRIGWDYGRINMLVLGEEAGKNLPALDYFPLGMALVVGASPSDDFWNELWKTAKADPLTRESTQSFFEVHHTKMDSLKEYYAAKGISVDDVKYLRGIPNQTHKYITTLQTKWMNKTVKEIINPNLSWPRDKVQIIKMAQNNAEFARRLQAFETKLNGSLSDVWIKVGDDLKTVNKQLAKIDSPAKMSEWLTRLHGKWSRLWDFLAGLAIFAIITDSAAFAINIANHNATQQTNWHVFRQAMGRCVDHVNRFESIPPRNDLFQLADAWANYWRSFPQAKETQIAITHAAMIKYIGTNAGP